MNREELRATLVDLYNEESGESLGLLHDNVHFVADLGLDSVDTVSLVMQVERHFRIRMTHEEISDAQTVGSMLDLIEHKIELPAMKAAA